MAFAKEGKPLEGEALARAMEFEAALNDLIPAILRATQASANLMEHSIVEPTIITCLIGAVYQYLRNDPEALQTAFEILNDPVFTETALEVCAFKKERYGVMGSRHMAQCDLDKVFSKFDADQP